MKNLLLAILIVFGLGCVTSGTVNSGVTASAMEYVIERTDAYLAIYPDTLDEQNQAIYVADKAIIKSMAGKTDRTSAVAVWHAVSDICDVHDGFVSGDPKLSEQHRKAYLKTTELVRKQFIEAFKASGVVPPTSTPTSRPVVSNSFLGDPGAFRSLPSEECFRKGSGTV